MVTQHAEAKHPKNKLEECFPCIPEMRAADAAAAAKAAKAAKKAAGGGGSKSKDTTKKVRSWTPSTRFVH